MSTTLLANPERARALKREAATLRSVDVSPRGLCDLELLLNGGLAPLAGFSNRRDYDAVLDRMRLEDGTLCPLPIVLDVPAAVGESLRDGERVALRDREGHVLAILTVDSQWPADKPREAQAVFGTVDAAHPGVEYLLNTVHDWYVGGSVEGVALPVHYDFPSLRRTPSELRRLFAERCHHAVLAVLPEGPLHRADIEATSRTAAGLGAHVLVHAPAAAVSPADIDQFTRIRCYQAVAPRFVPGAMTLALLPFARRFAGPREALCHALIERNYGATHVLVGRDHGGPAAAPARAPFYPPGASGELLRAHEAEVGVTVLPADIPDNGLTEAELARRIAGDLPVPDWFSFPEVLRELHNVHRGRARQGFTVFFTGLSGAGKSTLANALTIRLMEIGGRRVTLLDGDDVRAHLSSELGFSREHRTLNVRRIGYVAAEITKHGGVAICAPIAPYASVRAENRRAISAVGGYIEVHVATPLAVCERRDAKGLYQQARAGLLPNFTGVNDPYDEPAHPEVRLDTTDRTPDECVDRIVEYLRCAGYLPAAPHTGDAEAPAHAGIVAAAGEQEQT